MSTRAVILDVVSNLSAGSFVQSFCRYVAKRGSPALMISANGTSFAAEETQSYVTLTNSFIDWKFNVPEAPWEGLVVCVKSCLKRTIGHQ